MTQPAQNAANPAALHGAELRERGFTILRNVFAPEEMDILKQCIDASPEMQHKFNDIQTRFGNGEYPSFESIFVWNDTSGYDLFSYFSRRRIIFETIGEAFSDAPYVYHNKVALKYPNMPGFSPHQDYFYWYDMGCLYPDMATCFIAIDDAFQGNGCLKVIEGSHKLGRLNHVEFSTSDSGVDPDRLAAVRERHAEVSAELARGDCIIFHCNTIHGSDANLSDSSRLSLLACYNTRRNNPIITDHPHPNYIEQDPLDARVTAGMAQRTPDYYLNYMNQAHETPPPRWPAPISG